jgi:hypothetical protein
MAPAEERIIRNSDSLTWVDKCYTYPYAFIDGGGYQLIDDCNGDGNAGPAEPQTSGSRSLIVVKSGVAPRAGR